MSKRDDVIKYFNKVTNLYEKYPIQAQQHGEELFEILALSFSTTEPKTKDLRRLVLAQLEYQNQHGFDAGLSLDALAGAPREVIPLLVAHELDRRHIELEPRVGWGVWLNQFNQLTSEE